MLRWYDPKWVLLFLTNGRKGRKKFYTKIIRLTIFTLRLETPWSWSSSSNRSTSSKNLICSLAFSFSVSIWSVVGTTWKTKCKAHRKCFKELETPGSGRWSLRPSRRLSLSQPTKSSSLLHQVKISSSLHSWQQNVKGPMQFAEVFNQDREERKTSIYEVFIIRDLWDLPPPVDCKGGVFVCSLLIHSSQD